MVLEKTRIKLFPLKILSFLFFLIENASQKVLTHEAFYKNASNVYDMLNKTVSLTISQSILNQPHIQTMWYSEYIKVRNESTTTSGLYGPYLRLVTVMERGVYFKIFDKTWRHLNPMAQENIMMTKLFELPKSNPITAAHIQRNNTVVAVAYKNLSVEVFDMKSIEQTPEGEFKFKSFIIDTRYKFGIEEDHEILAIGRIPNTEHLIFSSNRFEIIKADRITGAIIKREKNPLEKIRYIGTPCRSHRTDIDPFNPDSTKDPEINKVVFDRANKPHFIATGAEDPMNAVIDWITLKAISFFSLHLQFVAGIKREDDIIGSLTYYGGIPQAHIYLISKRGVSPILTVYTGIYSRDVHRIYSRDVHSYDLKTLSANKVVNWIYATIFISVYYPNPIASGQGRPMLKIISPHADRMNFTYHNDRLLILESQQVERFELAQLYLQLGKKPSEPMYYMEKFYELDSLYVSIFNKSNSIRVEPPAIEWDHCKPRKNMKMVDSEEDPIFMFYGRYMLCYRAQIPLIDNKPSEEPFTGFCSDGLIQRPYSEKDGETFSDHLGKNMTLINCGALSCAEEELPHYDDSSVPEGGGVHFSCASRYDELDENMKTIVNQNDCWFWFNKNPFGVCQYCHFPSSDCLLFGADVPETYNFDVFGYHYGQKDIYYKDYRIPSIFNVENVEQLFIYGERNLMTIMDELFVWRYQNKLLSVQCYALREDSSNPEDYLVSARGDYTLVKAKNHPYNISKQISEIGNGSLTELVCIKQCLVGEFYEFESISCRKCNLGCGVCKSFENCTRCIPEFNKIQDSKSHKDIQEGYPVGFCRPGCQPGFHPIRFNGECRECPETCLNCRDKTNKELIRSKETGIDNDIYCMKCREKDLSKNTLYVNLSTGECTTECKGFGVFADRLNLSNQKSNHFICGKCFDPHCQDCNKDTGPKACTLCGNGFNLQSDGTCRSYWDTNEGILMISLIVVGSITTLIILAGLFFCICLNHTSKEDLHRLRTMSGLAKNKRLIQNALRHHRHSQEGGNMKLEHLDQVVDEIISEQHSQNLSLSRLSKNTESNIFSIHSPSEKNNKEAALNEEASGLFDHSLNPDRDDLTSQGAGLDNSELKINHVRNTEENKLLSRRLSKNKMKIPKIELNGKAIELSPKKPPTGMKGPEPQINSLRIPQEESGMFGVDPLSLGNTAQRMSQLSSKKAFRLKNTGIELIEGSRGTQEEKNHQEEEKENEEGSGSERSSTANQISSKIQNQPKSDNRHPPSP